MAKKAPETAGKTVEVEKEKPERNASGFYIYIGPNLKSLIQTGTILRGTREEALAKAEQAVKAEPRVKALIVSGDDLPQARIKVKTPGNDLYEKYMHLKGKYVSSETWKKMNERKGK